MARAVSSVTLRTAFVLSTLLGMTRTVNELFYRVVGQVVGRLKDRQAERVMLHRGATGWIGISSHELYRNTAGVARALREWKIAKGDRVAILSENRPEWATADFAAMLLGAVVVPIYPTLTQDQVEHLLRDSGSRVAFVSTQAQLDKVLGIQAHTGLERVVVMNPIENPRASRMDHLMQAGPEGRDPVLDATANAITSEDLATLLYTSGTTGIPKGVMLTHGNLACNFSCSLGEFGLAPGSSSVSFLPLSHITARHVDYALLHGGVTLAYCPFLEELPRALREVRPAIFVAVPRVYEKIRLQAEQTARSFAKRHILDWALAVGREHRTEILAGETPTAWSWRMADRIVFSQIRQGMGGQVQIYISGGAPLGRELAEWYADAGIRIHEGYGLTETSPVIAVNSPKTHRLGTVGKPLSNVEVRIAEDGEILVRGPSVFGGYWNMPKESAEAFTDGFFKTGDIGNLDADGYLSVTDRKKDLIKTSGGKFIAPQPIEASLKDNALVAEAVVIGDKRKFPAAMILPYFPLLEDWAHDNQVTFLSREELVRQPRVQALYEDVVENVNENLARFEKLKKTIVLAEEFSVASGTLTPTLKMKRRAVEAKHREEIDALYAAADQAPKE
jgi:long-chain acyl-CoA synthetase